MKKKKALLILSIFSAFLGVLFISSSNISTEQINKNNQTIPIFSENYTWTPEKIVWTKQCYLTSGDNVSLKIVPPTLWGYGPYDTGNYPDLRPSFVGPKLVYVDFILNNTLQTWFELWYYQDVKTYRVIVVNRTIYGNRNDCLIINGKPPLKTIGGMIKYSGNYTIRISGPFPPVTIPPGEIKTALVWITLNKILENKEIGKIKPYNYLLIPGLVLIFFSLASGIFYKK